YAQLTQEMMGELTGASGRLAEALWWESLTRESIQREWALNLGQRTAFERVAHLMCELFVRQRALGIGEEDRVPFPMTQNDLSDATGMSNVHVNRTVQELRSRHLITLRNGELIVHNLNQLMSLAMFDPGYLHLRHVR
ncbi:Crp/Fnr family transcriptional regulator, partial [Rhizobiaceae sp. 2RAB30]